MKRLREVRRRGRGSTADFRLLFDALEACSGPSAPLERAVARTPDLHLAFQLESGETLACVRIWRGRMSKEPHAEPASTRVILPPTTAERMVTGHPAGVLSAAYFDGSARVEGRVWELMDLLNLLEHLTSHIDSVGGGR